jgi:hypothetical protein
VIEARNPCFPRRSPKNTERRRLLADSKMYEVRQTIAVETRGAAVDLVLSSAPIHSVPDRPRSFLAKSSCAAAPIVRRSG